jgi:response regulator RpfG family c-di-GMP phosphodiesterase
MSVAFAERTGQPSVHDLWLAEAERIAVPEPYLDNMESFLAEMHAHHTGTYEHSMRVGMLAPQIGSLMSELEGISPKVLFYAGTMHDRGKLKTPRELLDKTNEWTEEDAQALKAHPVESYEALMEEGMPLTAGAVILHHRFQVDPYPAEVPEPDPNLPEHLVKLQPVLGRVIALADFYDASHRDDSDGRLSGEEIRAKVYKFNPDLTELIDRLYAQGVFSS